MSSKQLADLKAVTKALIIQCLESKGFKQDAWGHWSKHAEDMTIRYKFMDNAIRREVKMDGSQWRPSRSGYYKNVTVVNNKVVFEKEIGKL